MKKIKHRSRQQLTKPITEQPQSAAGKPLLDMEQAIQALKTTRPTFYRWLRSGKLKGMKAGRQWRFYEEDVERFLKGQGPRIDLPVGVDPLSDTLEERIRSLGEKPTRPLDDNKLAHTVRLLVQLAGKMRASDIHIEPRYQDTAYVRFRVDGTLHAICEIDSRLLPAIVNQWKTMASCNVRETIKPQDGRLLVDLGGSGKQIELRVCFLPTVTGESITARILDRAAGLISLDRIPFNERDREKILRWIQAPSGIIMVTGPTGCGKTSTLYAFLNQVVTPASKVMTIEDPVEYFLPGTTQTAVNNNAGVTIPSLLRSFLRSDPDIIMVAEIRDRETLGIAQQVALTGHLLLTTIHTSEAATALQRMVDLGGNPFMVGDSTKLIVAQRLVRMLCAKCSVERAPTEPYLETFHQLARIGGIASNSLPTRFREPVGCPACHMMGYRGRTIIAETLEVTPAICEALNRHAQVAELRSIAVREGMTTIAVDGIRRAAEGQTSLSEVVRFVSSIYATELTAA